MQVYNGTLMVFIGTCSVTLCLLSDVAGSALGRILPTGSGSAGRRDDFISIKSVKREGAPHPLLEE